MGHKLTIGLSLSLSGRYAAMGTQAHAALQLFAADCNAAGGLEVGGERRPLEIRCLDDGGSPTRCAAQYRALCFEERVDLIFGPYGSDLARAAAPITEAAGMVMVNHGAADDGLYQGNHRLLVCVPSPASEYFAPLAVLVGGLKLWRKRVATFGSKSPFGRAVISGFEQACRSRPISRQRVRLRVSHEFDPSAPNDLMDQLIRLVRSRVNVVVSAGSFEQDVALVDGVIRANLNVPVLACVAAGVAEFRAQLGEKAEGIVGPSQWEESAEIPAEIGPSAADFARRMRAEGIAQCDYPAAQIYAAGLLAAAALKDCGSLEQERLRAAFAGLRTSTLLGDFAIDPASGRQIGHQSLLVQWHRGQKVIIHPDAHAESGEIEFPAGWKLVLASLSSLYFRLNRKDEHDGTEDDDPGDD